MYNTDLPNRADLPSSAQLRRSTWIAGISAAAILGFIVLPSEYAIDPTGVGRMMGLTQMGEIKMQLAEEAANDAALANAPLAAAPLAPTPDLQIAERLSRIEGMLVELADSQRLALPAETAPGAAPAQPESATPMAATPTEERFAETAPQESAAPAASAWRDDFSFVLTPGEGVEIKLVMQEGEQAEFEWTANGAVVNYDTHGDGGGNSVSYEKGRAVAEQQGVLQAAFTGNHGWFWRNRTDADVTMTLRTRGTYSELKR